jgi:predicted nucleotidyltransferase component of viral defense system
MKEPIKNVAASILARLRHHSQQLERPFAENLQYYAMERFLYRLSKTSYTDKFILKGGLMFYVWELPLRRPTRDIDFRGYVSSSSKTLLKIIRDVIAVSVPEDGIVIDPQSVSIEETQIDADYQGIRVKMTVLLERSRIPLQIDIGFSDDLSSKAETIDYPSMLPNLKTARMKAYPKEAVVAEKFHAMLRHGDLNSRMKDYYDIWLISETFEFESHALQKAIETTFKNRDTELPTERPASLSAEFASANNTRWNNFLDKMNISTTESANFANIMEQVWKFLEHPLRASLHNTKSTRKWIPNKGWK